MKFVIATGIYPPEIGGVATVAAGLVRALKERGQEVAVVTYGEDRGMHDVHAVSRKGSVLVRYIRFALVLRRVLASDDILLATDVFSVGIPARLALVGRTNRFLLRLGGEWAWEDAVQKRRVHTTLRKFWENETGSMRQKCVRLNYAWILKRAERIAVTSDFLKEVIVRIVPQVQGRIETVWNRFISAHSVLRREPHDPLRLFYVGRFARVKNIPFLARVLRKLVDQGFPLSAKFVGEGTDLAEVKMILKDIPSMVFLPPMEHDHVMELFKQADLHVLPSLSDICPNSVLEALGSGVPCLMTREHGLPHPLSGVIEIDPQDESAWIEGLKTLIKQKETHARLLSEAKPPMTPPGPTLVEFCLAASQPQE